MKTLALHDFHQSLGATFVDVQSAEAVGSYRNPIAEYVALREAAGVLDLSFRGRLVLAGVDRQRFLHSQVTNNIKDLDPGEGCYAALVNSKGRMQSDLNVYCLAEALLLDFEPGLTERVRERLDHYRIRVAVELQDWASRYALLSVQGPRAGQVVHGLGLNLELPVSFMHVTSTTDPRWGQVYCAHLPRGTALGFDLFVPVASLATAAERLGEAAKAAGGCLCGWQALETVRIEAGIPRYGADMDESNLPPEAGIEGRAVSYTKGCYLGQEVIARIRAYGQVAKTLHGLRLADNLHELPKKGDKLLFQDQEAGYVTSATASPGLRANVALGYVRREHDEIGTALRLVSAGGESTARVVPLPFSAN